MPSLNNALKLLDAASFWTKQIVDGLADSAHIESRGGPKREGVDGEPSNGRVMVNSLVFVSQAEPKSPNRRRPGHPTSPKQD
jgi:hypothetical protein